MINVNIDTVNCTAKPSASPVIKPANVPVTIVFSSDPGIITTLEIALSAQSSTPAILAYLNAFTKQNETTYNGWLNANDIRLLAWLSGKQTLTVDCEIAYTVNSERQVCPNFSVTIQPLIIAGPATSDGGPTYVALDGSGAIPIGAGARLLPITNGVKLQVSIDGATWQDVETHVAT